MRQFSSLLRRQKTNKNHMLIRFLSSSSNSGTSPGIRVAIIGGGASGLSTALQLAPLAEKGLIAKPIDIYEKSCLASSIDASSAPARAMATTNLTTDSWGSGVIGKEIGVGIWNTALEPFQSERNSHKDLIRKLEHSGQYIERVGYRTPKGDWLTKTTLSLPPSMQPNVDANATDRADPSLLFIREKDFLASLREAVHTEQECGTIQMHYAPTENDESTTVESVTLPDSQTNEVGNSGYLQFKDGSVSSTDYQMLIAADGMKSTLRTKYSGYDCSIRNWKAGKEPSLESAPKWPKWQKEQLKEKHSIEDRKYVVFRGNAPLKGKDIGTDGVSFQTWGEGKNMRFALVGMSHPTSEEGNERTEKQVWFATICDEQICSNNNPEDRKDLLLKSFENWHDPIRQLIESTPAEKILMERGMGHRHSLLPVMNLAEVMQYQNRYVDANSTPMPYHGPGPMLLFAGDAYMTIDPVLAQGFTIGMEAGADLAATLESCLVRNGKDSENHEQRFDFKTIRDALLERNQRRFGRVMCLIRSTELVQSLAQPSTEFTTVLTKNFVRPAMMMIPAFIKQAAFSVVMKYSLGYYGNYTKAQVKQRR
jgi:2-polyprenyl-6-methoxyphenol hydroxylase-like FAD-dependent oxidoreductase